MTPRPARYARRSLLGLAAASLTCRTRVWAAGLPVDPFPGGVSLVVAGPEGGAVDGWADLLAPSLGRALNLRLPPRKELSGAADGVTGANQFDARSAPDGATALLMPGAAIMHWLVGDPRTHFDIRGWVPLMAISGSGILAGRARGVPQGRLRLAASTPAGAELPALLALDLLGVDTVPVFGLGDERAADDALRQGTVDLVFVAGRNVMARLAVLAQAGAGPVLAMGAMTSAGTLKADPRFPRVPYVESEVTTRRATALASPLFRAWRAATQAVQTDMAAALPPLTSPSMVALWRRAADAVTSDPTIQAAAARLDLRAAAAPVAMASMDAMAADAPTLLELRRWLAVRFNWRPS